MLAGKTREKLQAQVKDAAERIASSVMTVLAIALVAVVLSAGALLVSLRATRLVRA